jgi:hypothetical protein
MDRLSVDLRKVICHGELPTSPHQAMGMSSLVAGLGLKGCAGPSGLKLAISGAVWCRLEAECLRGQQDLDACKHVSQ